MISVLHVCDLGQGNPFIDILYKGLKDYKGITPTFSVDEFWNNENYDIIHFHWPEVFTKWNSPDLVLINNFKTRLFYLKERGVKFVYTKHNLTPHEIYNSKLLLEFYNFI